MQTNDGHLKSKFMNSDFWNTYWDDIIKKFRNNRKEITRALIMIIFLFIVFVTLSIIFLAQ